MFDSKLLFCQDKWLNSKKGDLAAGGEAARYPCNAIEARMCELLGIKLGT